MITTTRPKSMKRICPERIILTTSWTRRVLPLRSGVSVAAGISERPSSRETGKVDDVKTVSRLGERMAVLAVTVCCILAALTVLNGCGGGGGGGHVPESSGIRNTAGVDIRDTWKPTGPVKSYFGLEQGGDDPRIVGFDSSEYSILGSKDGITYGQRMSGPTDTIDIDFTGYFDQLPDYVQGALERAGKSWSYRLRDALGSLLCFV